MARRKKQINIDMGRRLKELRKAQDLTQDKFAEILDVGVEHYRRIESGGYGLSSEKLMLLYELYGIDPTYLVTGQMKYNLNFQIEMKDFSKEERDKCAARIMEYTKKLLD